MDLFIIRHAAAAKGSPDAERPLSPVGRQQFARTVNVLRALGVGLDAIHASPLRRAAETAQILQPLLQAGEITVDRRLADQPDLALVASLAGQRVALVGHAPSLPELVAVLVGGSSWPTERLAFEPGTVAWLVGQPAAGRMLLRALLPPGV